MERGEASTLRAQPHISVPSPPPPSRPAPIPRLSPLLFIVSRYHTRGCLERAERRRTTKSPRSTSSCFRRSRSYSPSISLSWHSSIWTSPTTRSSTQSRRAIEGPPPSPQPNLRLLWLAQQEGVVEGVGVRRRQMLGCSPSVRAPAVCATGNLRSSRLRISHLCSVGGHVVHGPNMWSHTTRATGGTTRCVAYRSRYRSITCRGVCESVPCLAFRLWL
jgi:hypothetical protein